MIVYLLEDKDIKSIFAAYQQYNFSVGEASLFENERAYLDRIIFLEKHLAVLGSSGSGNLILSHPFSKRLLSSQILILFYSIFTWISASIPWNRPVLWDRIVGTTLLAHECWRDVRNVCWAVRWKRLHPRAVLQDILSIAAKKRKIQHLQIHYHRFTCCLRFKRNSHKAALYGYWKNFESNWNEEGPYFGNFPFIDSPR